MNLTDIATDDPVCIFWFRRDLRIEDNHGLSKALNSGLPVVPIFIFDPEILESLPKEDARVTFIHNHIEKLHTQLAKHQSGIITFHDKVIEVFKSICSKFNVEAVFCNHDYEPYARDRDKRISGYLQDQNIRFETFKDQVIFEKDEVLKDDGSPYTVFTPYMKTWKARLEQKKDELTIHSSPPANFYKMKETAVLKLDSMGFTAQQLNLVDNSVPDPELLIDYKNSRDFPARHGTTRLSVHLRFGTVSIRKLVSTAIEHSNTWLNELIWREFYMMILWHFPYVVNSCFKPAYDHLPWRDNEADFERWCKGETGYPFVDAGMRELNQTGYMHNRLRMVTASFLTKHLLINWQWGEAYFAEKLLDFELSSNNGGWQWAAGCGCDAAPYFRIFNPMLQADKFDPDRKYINEWVPENQASEYPEPMVEHKFARERALKTFKETLDKQ